MNKAFFQPSRRAIVAWLPAAALAASGVAHAQARDFPNKPIELIVPFQPGGGTDAVARAYADAARRHIAQTVLVVNKPGASGAIGWQDLIASRPDGYRIAVVTVELVTLPPLNMAKFTADDVTPIARLNADPSAITVRADAPWNSIEEFLAAAKAQGGKLSMGNAGNGSIWHLAAAALEDKTGVKFNHTPFQGGGPAVLALMGGHIDAVAVSPAEVTTFVQAGKLRTLAVMADQRVKGFEKVPTLKERGIDLSIGTWRGLAAPRNTPPEVIAYLKTASEQIANEPSFREVLDKQNLGFAYADDQTFKAAIAKDSAFFRNLVSKVDIRN
ncbi:tripartite tricarboxylate transporter substrate binding protein [Xylophilus sp. GOD-11R]|uniref:tripartite tricarboxylate transporter substrate binding protein n=1 Tax=Xylophilus sp. GOD-11R TaxID=3089814 RepID=UPI00298C4B63|nr:tripartite tricarboxylate transporter substrate binding protein [Xylophilus sp. GOD-11R]WPB58918.1 tripartite tricarboxylate transporter substrate binding protein [Xylophilus sp. GOD-11R]